MEPAVVLNPATRVNLIRDILPMVHHVLIMSVNRGSGDRSLSSFRWTRSASWRESGRNWG